jgi:hypothetical protein
MPVEQKPISTSDSGRIARANHRWRAPKKKFRLVGFKTETSLGHFIADFPTKAEALNWPNEGRWPLLRVYNSKGEFDQVTLG